MKKLKIISLILVLVMLSSGCSLFKSKNMDVKVEVENNNQPEKQQEVMGKPTAWQVEEEISVEAAKMMAESEGIPFTKENLLEFYQNNYDRTTKPQSVESLEYSMNAIENIVGIDNILAKTATQYVMTKMREKKQEELNNLSQEELNKLMDEYSSYMETMGIVESAREEYIKSMYLSSQVELDIDEIYQSFYTKATLKVFSKYNPDYIKSLGLQ